MTKITYFGTEKDISDALAILKQHEGLERMRATDAKLLIQQLIDQHHLKASIHVNGSAVWSKERILKNLEKIMKSGTLYDQDQTKPPVLSHYFYQFLHTVCGSTAHVDIHGWIHKYPTLEHLKKFFKSNEFGKPVVEWIPKQRADAREIVVAIEKILFPFQTYMKTRQ